MENYVVDVKKKRKALRQVLKENINNSKGFVRFCYGLTIVMQVCAIFLGILNIRYVLVHENPLALIFLILTFLFPMLFSLLPATVYMVSCGGELRFRRNEKISLKEDEFLYAYQDDRIGFEKTLFVFHIVYDKIQRYEYSEKTSCLTLYGKIMVDIYKSGKFEASEEYEGIDLLDVYDVSLLDLIKENCPGQESKK